MLSNANVNAKQRKAMLILMQKKRVDLLAATKAKQNEGLRGWRRLKTCKSKSLRNL